MSHLNLFFFLFNLNKIPLKLQTVIFILAQTFSLINFSPKLDAACMYAVLLLAVVLTTLNPKKKLPTA